MRRASHLFTAIAACLLCAAVWAAPAGQLEVNITNVLGDDLPGKVELHAKEQAKPEVIEVPKGALSAKAPVGTFKAYVYIYTQGVPVLVDVKDVTITTGNPAFLMVNVLEGTGTRPLLDFDQDCDFALDSVETACGTSPTDAASVPGRKTLPIDDHVFAKKEGWYKGELHAHSTYGGGKESVAELVKRAEREGLDFLAIADRNTMKACSDPAFKSSKVALIPALEWGCDDMGVALIYAPRTFPEFVKSIPQAQALVDLVQAQDGFFAIAHPCFPTMPWQWGLSFVNGIEVWCRDWSTVPPLSAATLNEDSLERVKGKYIQSIAFAAASAELPLSMRLSSKPLSANDQANTFYDAELVRGLKAAVIAGSNSSSPEVPIARPVTYVYALEKSVRGIVNGLRRGRTFVSSSVNGPRLSFDADVLSDADVDVSIGGVIPLGVPTRFAVGVEGAKGQELQILCNGRPLVSKEIEGDAFALHFKEVPRNYSVYRVRVIASAQKESLGPVDVLAMSSPIYAQQLDIPNKEIEQFKKQHPDKEAEQPQLALPPSPGTGELKPRWRF